MEKDKNAFISIGSIDLSNDNGASELHPDDLPLLVTRDLVLFPDVVFPISLGRESSVKVAETAEERGLQIGVVCQINAEIEHPDIPSDIYEYGVTASVLNVFDLPDGSKTALVKAGSRFRVIESGAGKVIKGLPSAKVELRRDISPRMSDKEFGSLVHVIRDTTLNILRKSGDSQGDLSLNVEKVENPLVLVNLVATYAPFSSETKQEILRISRVKERAFMLLSELTRSEQMANIMEGIRARTKQRIDEHQRNAFLHNQMEAIREELYGDEVDDLCSLREKAATRNMPEQVSQVFDKEIERLSRLNPQSPDYSMQYSYVEMLADLPWNEYSTLSTDFMQAEEILNADHYGLEKVKERVLEQLAVMMNTPEGRAPIICLVGAPGVGKTSLGQSIANALGRKYHRVSLGGMHDEAEIRGHRRTYIGSMPGRIIDAIKRTGTSNPLLLLDEIDKVGKDFRGDPSAALLEVLDPEQNHRFHDNYIDVDYDLSKVLFIATANTLSTIPQPLQDRMEIIEMPGYLPEEKLEIARRHLIPRALADNAFKSRTLRFTSEAINFIIERYTNESGVRQLEKEIAGLVRKIVLRRMRGLRSWRTITSERVRELLGVEKYSRERYEYNKIPGVATGLAWTAVGGEILFIESSLSPAKGEKLTLTGNLGDVMKESAMIALQYVKSHSSDFGINLEQLSDHTLHIHVPEGAIPKDGPSAGITMASSIISTLTGRPVRPGIAMTGELTLRGKVLPVGGIKEKVLAAKRAGISQIILSKDNAKDIADIRADYLQGMKFDYVTMVDEVISYAIGVC